jgi:uncharacterized protein
MCQTTTLVWTAPQGCESGWHAEFARLELWASGLRAAGTQLGIEPVPYRLDYRLDAGGEGFATRCLRVEAAGDGWERHLHLERHPDGDWAVEATSEGQGELPAPGGDPKDLAGALDCDLEFSPLTNAMPVLRHRLHRKPGTVDLLMAWISVPDLSVHALAQRYTQLGSTGDGARVRYESLEDGEVVFTQDLELDPRGLVRLYPQLARRIA